MALFVTRGAVHRAVDRSVYGKLIRTEAELLRHGVYPPAAERIAPKKPP